MAYIRIHFTRRRIDSLPPAPCGKRTYYRDEKTTGLLLIVNDRGNKTFSLYRKAQGRPVRVALGKYGEISIEAVRNKAVQLSLELAEGKNPNRHKQKMRKEITFGELFEQFMERYSKKYKKSWKYDEREVNRFLSHWFRRPVSTITRSEVLALHERVAGRSGIYQANRLLERIRAIYNKGIEWGMDCPNPTKGIKKFKEKSRSRFLQASELPRFLEALAQEGELIRDYITLLLLTGARKSNMLAMRWDEINFDHAIWRIPETKNGEPVSIPLTGQAQDILHARKKRQKEQGLETPFVFPSETASGHYSDPKNAWARILKNAGIEGLRIHDLRRTVGSWQAITGATTAIIGKSLGHKSQYATAVYERLTIDPVRDSLERATKAMWSAGQQDKDQHQKADI